MSEVTNETQNRFKSKVVWASVLAQVLVIVGLFLPQLSDTIKVIGTSILEIVTVLGILNNPSDATNF
jgi:uncharacterized membrane protein